MKENYKLQISDRGTISLQINIHTPNEFEQWTGFLSKCYTIENLRMELASSDIPLKIQTPKVGKSGRVQFIEENIEIALTKLLEISSPTSIALTTNTQYWKEFSQRELQGIFKRVVQNHIPSLQFLLKQASSDLYLALTKQHLKISINLPVQKFFPSLIVHPTPVFPSVAYIMLQLGLEQVPNAFRFVDAMCGAGNIALIVAQVLKNIPLLFVGGFDKDPKWIEAARENSRSTASKIDFIKFDLYSDNFLTTFPFRDYDVLFAHPPYGHFVQYSTKILIQLYRNVLQIFQVYANKHSCLVLNSPRDDILVRLIDEFSFELVKTLDIPRKTTTIKLWVLKKNNCKRIYLKSILKRLLRCNTSLIFYM